MAKVMNLLGTKPVFNFPIKTIDQIAQNHAGLRRTKLADLASERAYFFSGFLARLEQALISYTTTLLRQRGFQFISVPDILKPDILEGCGMLKTGEHQMVYFLDAKRHGRYALSGTSEMALGAFWRNKHVDEKGVPIRMAAVSRCYRAEISDIQEGIYRVHEFNKVEMFGVCRPNQSEELLEEFLGVQKHIVNSLELYAQVLDMPKDDLGLAADRKYDIEAWMPGQDRYGEISSTSNCTDFQSGRLNITYSQPDATPQFVHTVNGTACAVPRMLIALLEQHQLEDGSVNIPAVLRKYFNGVQVAEKSPTGSPLRWRGKGKVSSKAPR